MNELKRNKNAMQTLHISSKLYSRAEPKGEVSQGNTATVEALGSGTFSLPLSFGAKRKRGGQAFWRDYHVGSVCKNYLLIMTRE